MVCLTCWFNTEQLCLNTTSQSPTLPTVFTIPVDKATSLTRGLSFPLILNIQALSPFKFFYKTNMKCGINHFNFYQSHPISLSFLRIKEVILTLIYMRLWLQSWCFSILFIPVHRTIVVIHL